jgi:hypothetical protein
LTRKAGAGRVVALGLTGLVGVAGVVTGQSPANAGTITTKASCGSQAVANWDDGYIVLGEDANMQKAPYAECGTNYRAKTGTKIWSWCTVENDYGNTWLWGRVDGTETYGWVYIEHAKELVEKPTSNDGWCQNERPPNNDEIDGPDRIVEKPPVPDADDALPVQEYDGATDVDPAVPPVGGKQDGTMPADDYVAPEGDEANDPTDVQTAAARMVYGAPIKRAKVIARAKNWYSRNVPYSQHAFAWDVNRGKKFRTDCSGFVSMSWALKDSRNTRNLNGVATRINWSSLKPGDMVLRNGHVQLFEKWANRAKTSFWIYEEGSTASDMNHYKVALSRSKSGGYKPWRYNKIRD